MTFFLKKKETVKKKGNYCRLNRHETYQPNTAHALHLESDSNKPTIKRYWGNWEKLNMAWALDNIEGLVLVLLIIIKVVGCFFFLIFMVWESS